MEDLKGLYERLIEATIAKDSVLLNELIADEAEFLHFSERPLTKEEYIRDIMDELFTYYDYEIKHVENDSIIVRIDAELYGSKRNWWIFCIKLDAINDNGKIKIKRSQIVA